MRDTINRRLPTLAEPRLTCRRRFVRATFPLPVTENLISLGGSTTRKGLQTTRRDYPALAHSCAGDRRFCELSSATMGAALIVAEAARWSLIWQDERGRHR